MARHGCEIKEPRIRSSLDIFMAAQGGRSILQMDYYRAEVRIMAMLNPAEKPTNG